MFDNMALNYVFIGFFSIAFVMAVFQYFYHGIDIFSLLVQRTFDDAGTYDYYCMVHPWMTGIVNVQ